MMKLQGKKIIVIDLINCTPNSTKNADNKNPQICKTPSHSLVLTVSSANSRVSDRRHLVSSFKIRQQSPLLPPLLFSASSSPLACHLSSSSILPSAMQPPVARRQRQQRRLPPPLDHSIPCSRVNLKRENLGKVNLQNRTMSSGSLSAVGAAATAISSTADDGHPLHHELALAVADVTS